jgi:hypothetical protein
MPGLSRRTAIIAAIIAGGAVGASAALAQTIDDYTRTAGGLTVYLGVMPAAIVKGHPMRSGAHTGPHEYHVVAAVFDAATGARISDAAVTAQVSGLGLSGTRKKLEPMEIAGTTTFGEFFNLPGRDLYTVKLSVERSGGAPPVVLEFKYDHRQG